ncbi:MAG: hypothetical protein APF78_03465 [Sphingomonadales bacterium BRH_c3]|nr:MAG: hypothetical protein APF78_03465 [Sphingomonadales bacterium BRH_c3]
MKKATLCVGLIAGILTASCQAPTEAPQIATLYRNGSIAKDLRLHFASFDAEGEANDYNINNCQMTARLLNANVSKQWTAQGLPDVGFWCEPGPYREEGFAPAVFDAEYPTDAQGYAAP